MFTAAFLAGFGVFVVGPAKILRALSPGPAIPALSGKVASGVGRVRIDGDVLTRAGGAVLTFESRTLTYRQTCRDACDTLVIDYDAPPQAAMSVTAAAADGRPIFTGGAYDDAGETHRLTADGNGRLHLTDD